MFSLARETLRRAREERLAQTAGSLTFTTVLALAPLLALSFALFTQLPLLRGAGLAVREHLLKGLLPAELSSSVLKHLAQFAANTHGLTLLGLAFVGVTVLVLLLNVENVLNRIWKVRKNRPLFKRLGLYAVMVVVAPVLLGASLWATSALQAASGDLLRTLPVSASLLLTLGPIVLGAIGFGCLFYFVPNAKVRRREALLGGLLAGIAFELGKRGFALYLQQVPTYRTVYGAFAPVLLFLLWIYFSWLVTLACALVAANVRAGGRPATRRLSKA
jgi:membrane protein